jgi:hypothetical protein
MGRMELASSVPSAKLELFLEPACDSVILGRPDRLEVRYLDFSFTIARGLRITT